MDKENKYFVVNELKLAKVMQILLSQRYFEFNEDGKINYTFRRTDNIIKIYGQAKTILEII